jgi:hypothetical protein
LALLSDTRGVAATARLEAPESPWVGVLCPTISYFFLIFFSIIVLFPTFSEFFFIFE